LTGPRYSETCLRRAWNAQRVSWRMTSLLHRVPEHDVQRRLELADLEEVTRSRGRAGVGRELRRPTLRGSLGPGMISEPGGGMCLSLGTVRRGWAARAP